MLSSGNARPEVCVNNLLNTWKKEAFYGRNKGIPTSLQDMPFSTAEEQLTSDAEDMINEFEERVEVNEVYTETDEDGEIILMADIDIDNETLDEDEEDEE